MIIKSKPISASSGSRAIFNHIANKIEENEYIDVLTGSRQNIDNCVTDAKTMNRTNSVIHFIISSDEEITREQALKCTTMLSHEFGFNEDDIMLMAEHGKSRHNGTSDNKHWHFLVRTNNPETGKTLNLSNSYKRQELISRTFEIENGLKLTQGRHNKYVYHHIDEKYRDLIAPLCAGDLPNSFTHDNRAQEAKRDGRDLFSLKDEARHIFSESSSWNDFKDKIQARGWTIDQGTKKPDVLILNDEKGKLIGSVSRVLGLKKDELTHMIEMPDNIIASRVVGGTSPDLTTAGEGLHPVEPAKTSESQPEAQEAKPAPKTQERPQENAGGHIVADLAVDSTQATDAMSKDEKQAIASQNSDKAQARRTMQESIASQERMAKALEDLMKQQAKEKKPQKTWGQTIDDEERKLIDIINMKHPKLKEISDKSVRNWIYKTYSGELDAIKNRREKISKLRDEIKSLRKGARWWNNKEKQASTKDSEEKEKAEKLQIMIMHVVHTIMYELRLTKIRPNPWNSLTEKEKRDYLIRYKSNQYAQMMFEQKTDTHAINRIALLKATQNNEKIREFQERHEVNDARNLLNKLNNLRQVDINELDQTGQNELRESMKNMDIDSALQAVKSAEKRQEIVEVSQIQQEPDAPEYSGNIVKFKQKEKYKSYSKSL
ncbi:relaxase/mobilization nuclease domain-containing protein [Acetobacter aceti]|uniref:MobA/VirD2-like nuclease domain-containing protein n=1 Tax=Acetobacter aceti TaxID=435 RepID=A0A6S6PKC0_ACEAC|nr:hypothetical protein [Acetobacter aceti]BCI67430.1 hypothetical protein AAJCM20276_20540 [Acetobacter aceti]